MGIQEPKFDLHEMQMCFENEIHSVRTLSDLELSENDYRRLGIKLKSLFAFASSSNFADDFMLCIAVYCTYNFIYWDEKYDKINGELFRMFEEQSQYTQRHQLDMFLECFHDFGLNGYQVKTGNLLKDCEQTAARHAGIPYDEQVMMFELLRRYLNVDCDAALQAMRPFLPRKTRHILAVMDLPMQQKLVQELQALVHMVSMENRTRDELRQAFPDLSVSMLNHCAYWWEQQALKTCSI